MSRPASHAGTWYSSNKAALNSQIGAWINATLPPFKGRFGVGPHAGLSYCGAILAQTYAALDTNVKRVFIMSPSHVKYFQGFRTTKYREYLTPLGASLVDTDITTQLHEAGVKYMDESNDTREHGVEMHVPFLQYVAPHAKIVPLVFCDLDEESERLALSFLGKYFNDRETAFMVSSDFCHWGNSFDYTVYSPGSGQPYQPLDEKTVIQRPIWQSIEELDHAAMKIAESGNPVKWKEYIEETGNTICGQVPLAVLMETAVEVGGALKFKWMGYTQSSRASSVNETSVSYASAVSKSFNG